MCLCGEFGGSDDVGRGCGFSDRECCHVEDGDGHGGVMR